MPIFVYLTIFYLKLNFHIKKLLSFKLTTASRRFWSQNLISRKNRITLDIPIYNDPSRRSFDNPKDTVGETGSGRHSVFSVNATKLLGTFATEREAPGMCENLLLPQISFAVKSYYLKIILQRFNYHSLIDIVTI